MDISSKIGVHGIELSSGALYQEDMYNVLKESSDSKRHHFLVHNYFPPPIVPFVLNLASADENVLSLSRKFCMNAIDIAADLGAPFFSVHSGFCVHAKPADLGKDFTALPKFAKERGNHIFIESLKNLVDYAVSKNIDLLIENNVVSSFNLVDGKNELLLGVTEDELLEIFEAVKRDNLGLLLDVAHLKISANALKFDPIDFIDGVAHKIKALHLSDNDGKRDTNDPISTNSWFWEPLLRLVSENAKWILEVYNLSLGMIIEQMSLMSFMADRHHR